MSVDLMNHVFRSLEKHFPSAIPHEPQQPMPGSPALVEGSSPTAGIGTADAGLPIVRYWTVKYRYGGSSLWDYTHVIACGPFKAAMVAHKQKPMATEMEVVREIQRDEFESMTRKSP